MVFAQNYEELGDTAKIKHFIFPSTKFVSEFTFVIGKYDRLIKYFQVLKNTLG